MNLNVLVNKIVKGSNDKNYSYCEWIFQVSCICDLCVKDRLLRSPKVVLDQMSTSFSLQIQLKSPSVFQICNASVEFDNFRIKLSIKNKNGLKCYNREYSDLSKSMTKNYLNSQGQLENEYTLKFLNLYDIQNCNYISSGVFTIVIEIFKHLQHHTSSRKVLNFYSDMKNFQQSEKLTDVTLVVGDRKFHAHKAILASRSSVFLAMFENEMKEKIASEVVIADASEQAVTQVLNYIYTETVDEENFKDLACEVLTVAHRFAIQGLVDICEVVLVEALNVNNAFNLLFAADVYKLDLLKKAVISFIAGNAKDLVESDEFKSFINSTQHHWLRDIFLAFG